MSHRQVQFGGGGRGWRGGGGDHGGYHGPPRHHNSHQSQGFEGGRGYNQGRGNYQQGRGNYGHNPGGRQGFQGNQAFKRKRDDEADVNVTISGALPTYRAGETPYGGRGDGRMHGRGRYNGRGGGGRFFTQKKPGPSLCKLNYTFKKKIH